MSASSLPALVLASASPRRRWLLAKLGRTFEVDAPDIPEVPGVDETPDAFAARMAAEKAAEVARRRDDAWILAADTVVTLDAAALGKPKDAAEAVRMLSALAGRRHVVYTGVALLAPGGMLVERAAVGTPVVFRTLSRREIDAYVATGEPFDRAGAYAIQGEGAHLVDRVEGSYTNVIGLPLPEVAAWLGRWRIL
ncbi:MAG: septum formation protein Maf [Deltaproteobacteria bacterium]|nr:septum formation protein Maf [Deltaproteobacteria bacterium]